MAGFMNFGGKSKFQIITSPEMDKERMLFFLEKQLKYEGANNVARERDTIFFSGFFPTYRRCLFFLVFGGRGVLHVAIEKDKITVVYSQSSAGIVVLYLLGCIFLLWSSSGNIVPTVETILFFFLFFCIATSINIFSRLVSLAMFIERVYDAFMKK
jgi:hypothetical protein